MVVIDNDDPIPANWYTLQLWSRETELQMICEREPSVFVLDFPPQQFDVVSGDMSGHVTSRSSSASFWFQKTCLDVKRKKSI